MFLHHKVYDTTFIYYILADLCHSEITLIYVDSFFILLFLVCIQMSVRVISSVMCISCLICDFSARYGNYSMKVFTYIIYILEDCSYNGYAWGLELGLNATTMFQLCHGGQLNWWRKLEFPEKTTDLRQSRTNFITY